MAAIDFPDNPTIGDTFTVGIRTWTWDGSVWKVTTFGRFGPPGVKIDSTPPENTEILWIDTEEPGSAVLPLGGETGQVLAKTSNDDYDTAWTTIDLSQIESAIGSLESSIESLQSQLDEAEVANIMGVY